MESSPLLLNRHVFKRVEIVASPKPDSGAVNLLNVNLGCSQAAGESNLFLVELDLKILPLPDSGKNPAYTGEVSIEGEFRVSPEVPEDQQQLIAICNGAGILFGAIREMVLGITARGPWGPLPLKILSFVEMARNMVAQSKAGRSGESRKEFARASED
jgi:preprotein translocase subunit SecB